MRERVVLPSVERYCIILGRLTHRSLMREKGSREMRKLAACGTGMKQKRIDIPSESAERKAFPAADAFERRGDVSPLGRADFAAAE
jgi:hypothetical protein